MVLERRAEYAEVARKLVVKRFLRNVYLCHEYSVVFVSDDGVMIHHSERSSVVGLWVSAAECQVMIVHHARMGDGLIEVRVISGIVAMHSHGFGCSHVFGGIEHLQAFIHLLETHVSFVRNLESSPGAFLGLHLYYTRGSARAVHGGFGSVLQYPEALYIGGVDGRKGSYIRSYAIYKHQRVVSSGDRGSTTHTHAV